MSGYYKLHRRALEQLYALFRLEHDVEFTVFGGDGRDATLKAYAGDVLVLQQIDGDRWAIGSVVSDEEAEDLFEPLGDTA